MAPLACSGVPTLCPSRLQHARSGPHESLKGRVGFALRASPQRAAMRFSSVRRFGPTAVCVKRVPTGRLRRPRNPIAKAVPGFVQPDVCAADRCFCAPRKRLLVRYADDFVIGFERKDDAERVMKALTERMAKYGLTLHPEKTRLLEFRPPNSGEGNKGTATFDFLGFTTHWRKTWKGKWRVAFKTRRARLSRAITAVADWCRRHRHQPVKEQHATLVRKLEGHYNYFGVNGNIGSLKKLQDRAEESWRKWLNRRSQRARMTWKRFTRLLAAMPLPEPRITVQIWARP